MTSPTAAAADYVARFRQAQREGRAVPRITAAAPDVSLDQSYGVQQALVAAALADGERIDGFKGALVAPGSKIGDTPVSPATGVLLASGRIPPGARLSTSDFRKLVIECEIAFVLDRPVTEEVASVEALLPLVRAVCAAIEFPDFAFDGPVAAVQDLVAGNVAAARHMLGAEYPPALPLPAFAPTLSRDGTLIARGDVAATVGDPWETLRRLLNMLVTQGHAPDAGHAILTGSIILDFAAQPGAYEADFGPYGTLAFTID